MYSFSFYFILTKKNTNRFVQESVATDKKILQREVVDSVWLMKEYKTQQFDIEKAIEFHKELAQPDMFNNMQGFLHVRLVLDMRAKKKVRHYLILCKFIDFFNKYFSSQKEQIYGQYKGLGQLSDLFSGWN